MRRILGLFAHPDDEIFCAGGTIATHVEAGANARVVALTKGEAGRISHVDLATRSTLGQVRESELAAAGAILGAETVCFDYPDGGLLDVERQTLVQTAVEQITDFSPDTVISFDHTGAYGHPDHIVAHEVALEACRTVEAMVPGQAPDRLLMATFPKRDQLLLELIVDWLAGLPERFKGSDGFVNAMLMFADSSSMLGFASDHLRIEWFPAGSFIVEQGEQADNLYLLLSGTVEVRREVTAGSLEQIATINIGEFIGESGLATGKRRSAHCITTTDCACFVLAPAEDDSWKPRGGNAEGNDVSQDVTKDTDDAGHDLRMDVTHLVNRKFEALIQHRSQYPIEAGLFPSTMLDTLLGVETFVEGWRSAQATALGGKR